MNVEVPTPRQRAGGSSALGVTEDQYTIVHKYLFRVIGDVLGDAVTPEVVTAWDEVYWLMAGAGPLSRARVGQYVSVRVLMPDGIHQTRQYSLSNAPGDGLLRITVKRVASDAGDPEGEVSNQLHKTVHAGDELTLSTPFGDVLLDGAGTPLVLVAAGIGCTPMAGMLDHLAATGSTRPVWVLHADRTPAGHALRAEVRRLVEQLPDARAEFWYEQGASGEPGSRTGLMDLDGLALPADADVYLCGPLPFMRAVRTQLLRAGIPARSLRYEVFGPDLWLAHAGE
ncbi:hypothetical protein [Streptomyces sp. SCL15-4]|uniref:hypothetical protein n=1 Tax=Streptomyces sp. SCL15-4 TaxID=2967221 RepID=UPI002966EFD4|nr:hypothetical protein [Streptomyces sp. SCL15-4]